MALDHSFMVPIIRLGLTHRRIVPLFVNCNTPPLPTLERCRDLGRALRQVIEGLNHETKVAVVATGGVSHWVGLPRFGDVNEEWDHDFLGWLASGDLDAILALSDEDIVEAAGNGALEVRTWVAAMACAGGDQADVLAYEPMPDWGIGIGIMRMVVAS
jgi:AmmeMemoRadiSam system protein B